MQFVNDPENPVNTHAARRCDFPQTAVSGQEYSVFVAGGGHQGEAVIDRKAATGAAQRRDLRDLLTLTRQIAGGETTVFERLRASATLAP